MLNLGIRPPPTWRGCNGLYVARKLGQSTGLKLVLDAGDRDSAPLSATSWLDLSGNGYDFFRGTTSSGQTSDPTFNGNVGSLTNSEYWSFDGGDYFTYDTSNETWMNNLHKDNAKFSAIFWIYYPGSGEFSMFGTRANNAGGNIGVQFSIDSTQFRPAFTSRNGSTFDSDNAFGLPQLNAGARWSMIGLSVDEAAGAGGSFFFQNGESEVFDGTYTSPTASNATYTLQIGARGNNNTPIGSGGRMAMCLMWEGATLTPGQMAAFFNATRGRFGA